MTSKKLRKVRARKARASRRAQDQESIVRGRQVIDPNWNKPKPEPRKEDPEP